MAVEIKNYNHLQTSASPMAGTAGYLDAILYSCLVTGFNSKTVSSIAVSSNVATITTSTNHNYTANDIIVISGANESQFNDEFRIKAVTSTTTFTVDLVTADGSATGTITCKIAPLGWTRVYSGTNKSVYRAPAGNRMYLRVDDTQAQYSTVAAYETMSDVDTGTNKMGDAYWKKSDASSTATREWYLIGNNKTFYLFDAWSSSYPTWHIGQCFGDFNSIKSGDSYASMLVGYNVNAPSNPSYNQSFTYTAFSSSNNLGHFLMRASTGVVGAVPFFQFATMSGQMGYNGLTYPNQADNGLHLFPVELGESNLTYRGRMPGLYTPLEATAGFFSSNDRTVVINDRTYLAIKLMAYSGYVANCFMDITGSW